MIYLHGSVQLEDRDAGVLEASILLLIIVIPRRRPPAVCLCSGPGKDLVAWIAQIFLNAWDSWPVNQINVTVRRQNPSLDRDFTVVHPQST